MKLVWSRDTASKAYFDTVKSISRHHHHRCREFESGAAEFISAMAAGWNAQLIVETWSRGGPTLTSTGLAVARRNTGGRHVCIVPDEKSRLEYVEAMRRVGRVLPEVIVGEAEEAMERLHGVDFLVVDLRREDFSRVLRHAKLGADGAVIVCKNASNEEFGWRDALEGKARLVRSVFVPVGNGLDIAHAGAVGGGSTAGKRGRRWIKHFDPQTGELHVFPK